MAAELAAPQGPQIWESSPNNECFDWAGGDEAKCTEAFAAAAHTASVEVVQNRVAPTSMETRNAIGQYDPDKDFYTLWSGNQGSAGLRDRACVVLNSDDADAASTPHLSRKQARRVLDRYRERIMFSFN